MPHYIDGYVIPVPKSRKQAYIKLARRAAKVFRDHGALAVHECWADDVKPGKLTSFPQAVKLKRNEAVVFSWIVFPSRKVRDRCNKAVMQDPRLADMVDVKNHPFDAKRMFWGGFKTVVAL